MRIGIGIGPSSPLPGRAAPSPQKISSELVSPTGATHLIVCGDSRLAAKHGIFMAVCDEIVWGGASAFYLNPGNSTGVHATASTTGGTGNSAPVSPYIGGNATWWPWSSYETQFLGGTETTGSDVATRIAYSANYSETEFPLLWERLKAGGAAKVRLPYYRHAAGMSGSPGVRMWWAEAGPEVGSSPGNAASSFVLDTTGSGYGFLEATLPDGYNWDIYPSHGGALVPTAQQGAATVNGEIFSFSVPWVEAETGAVVQNWAVGGAGTARFTGTTVPPEIWTTYVPLLGSRRLLWIALGTNDYGMSEAAHVTAVETIISRYRAGTPHGGVMITTEYPRGDLDTDGVEPFYVPAKRTVRDNGSGIMLLDTFPQMPTFPTGQALGFYGATRYTANGAHSAGATTLVVNEAITGPASGTLYLQTDAGSRSQVAYSSYTGSTFTTSALPVSVPASGVLWEGDTVHATDGTTGGTAYWARVIGDLVKQAAGDTVEIDQGLDGATLIDWLRARHVTSNSSRRAVQPNHGTSGDYAALVADDDPAITLSAALGNHPALTFNGSTTSLVSSAAASAYTALHNGTTRALIAIVLDPAGIGSGTDVIWSNTSDISPGIGLSQVDGTLQALFVGTTFTATASVDYAADEPALALVDIDPLGSGEIAIQLFTKSGAVSRASAAIGSYSAAAPSYAPTIGERPVSTFRPWSGDIAEVVVATGATDATIDSVVARLQGLYDFTVDVTAPTVQHASIDGSTTLRLVFTEELDTSLAVDETDFALAVDGVAVSLTPGSAAFPSNHILTVTTSRAIEAHETPITLTIAAGAVTDLSGNPIAATVALAVDNQTGLVYVEYDDTEATITSGSFDLVPNRGTSGGSFIAGGANRPTTTTQNGNVAALQTATQRTNSTLAASTFNGLHNGLGLLTAEVVIVPGTLNAANVMLSTYDGTATLRGFSLRATSAGALYVQVANGAVNTTIQSADGVYQTGVPIVIHVTIDGADYEIFAAGASVASGTVASPSTGDAASALHLGYPLVSAVGAAGTYCQARIMSAVLTPAQITAAVAALSEKWIP